MTVAVFAAPSDLGNVARTVCYVASDRTIVRFVRLWFCFGRRTWGVSPMRLLLPLARCWCR
jgi:hypothetical protein